MRTRAFTLAELLAVTAVVAVLMSLLLPTLAKAREKARAARCQGNLRQLGIAAQLYWDDHDGRAFPYRFGASGGGDLYWFGWLERGSEGRRRFDQTQGVLHPYLGGRGVELCASLAYGMKTFKLKAEGAACGYGYNLHLSAPAGQPALQIGALAPSRLAVLADAAQVNTFQAPASPEHPLLEEFYYISTNEPTTHFRHSRRAQAVFADAHAEPLAPAPDSLDRRLPGQILGRLASWHLDPRTDAASFPPPPQ